MKLLRILIGLIRVFGQQKEKVYRVFKLRFLRCVFAEFLGFYLSSRIKVVQEGFWGLFAFQGCFRVCQRWFFSRFKVVARILYIIGEVQSLFISFQNYVLFIVIIYQGFIVFEERLVCKDDQGSDNRVREVIRIQRVFEIQGFFFVVFKSRVYVFDFCVFQLFF